MKDRPMNALETTLSHLFDACPELCGFSLQDEGELCVSDLAILPYAQPDRAMGHIAVALIELMDEAPEARALLVGRTFARARH
jgi:hypothetical protein